MRRALPWTQCVQGPNPFGQNPRVRYELNGAVGIQTPLDEWPPTHRPDPATVAYAKRRESEVSYPLGMGESIKTYKFW
jgi:hypothetical protein